MESNRKKGLTKKDASRTEGSSFSKYASTQFTRPPTTGTSSSSSEDHSSSVKSSDDSPEDIIKIVPSPNNRVKEMAYPATTFKISRSGTKEGLDLKFDSAPSAYFTACKNDLPMDVTLSPQDGNRVPSPASISSLTSRPLEWDSGADVGYIAPGIETGLSTIERIALAQGSAILLPRSDPEGTTETSVKPIKIMNPAIEKLVGTPAAESTVIKDISSPLPGPKLFCPEGISPIIASNVQPINSSPLVTQDQVKMLQPHFENLSIEKKNTESITTSAFPTTKTDACHFNGGDVDKTKNQTVERDKGDVLIDSADGSGSKEDSKSAECLLEIGLENSPSQHPLFLKKSASCSNLLQASRPIELRSSKPLKRHFQNSASSSSISTVIDRSRKKSRKLFAPCSISEKAERSKLFKSPRKTLSPSKKLNISGRNKTLTPEKLQTEESLDQRKTENAQIAFHTSIQQSILDELQQCVNEMSNNFKAQKSNDKAESSGSSHEKKGSGSIRGNCSTLESVASVQTNDSWAANFNAKDSLISAEKAKSFEYLPGDIYERNSSECFQAQKKIESSSSTSEKVDFSGSSNEFCNFSSMSLFERDLERGVNLLKDFICSSTNFDSRKKQLLMKKIAKKLIDLDKETHKKSTLEPVAHKKLGGETYRQERIPLNQRKLELSGSTQSQSYIDTTTGSSCLNLVMRPLKKSKSVESSCPEKLSSGIKYIQDNYHDNCTFDSSNEIENNYLTSEISLKPFAKAAGRKSHQVLPERPSSVDWSKSSNSTETQQRVFYGSEYRWLNEPSKRHPVSPKRKLSKFQDRKKSGLLGENLDDLLDGRTVNLRRSFKPVLNSDNSAKSLFDYRPFPGRDWRKATSDSERRYEEKLIRGSGGKKESALLFNYLDAERRNHLLWIQSEINHLSNLKALIEKQEKLKEGFKVLKSKKVDSQGDHTRRRASCMKGAQVSSKVDSWKISDKESDSRHKTYHPSSNISRSSSDKENKDASNRTFVRNASAARPPPNVQRSKETKSQISSGSRYVSASSDVSINMCPEDSDKFFNVNHKQSSSLRQKKNPSLGTKIPKSISYTILFEPQRSTPAPIFQIPTRKIIKNIESSSTAKVSEPSLQECLAKKHPEIIKRAEFRRNCIAELACLRQLQNERKKKLVLACGSAEKISQNPSIAELPSLKEKRIFSQKKLRQQTENKYRKSFEVRQKLKEQKTKEEYRTNRLMAETFARKLQRKALKGQVNLSNSVMLIES